MFLRRVAEYKGMRFNYVGVGRGVARFGVVGDVGYGGCKPRIECIDKCK